MKTKLGREVKCIPKVWNTWNIINEDDSEDIKAEKEFYNRIVAEHKPYFFRYKYRGLNKELNEYEKRHEKNARRFFKTTMKDLEERYDLEREDGIIRMTDKERDCIRWYRELYPAINSDCIMNKLCKYIEGIDFKIKERVRFNEEFDYRELMSEGPVEIDIDIYNQLSDIVNDTFKRWEQDTKNSSKRRDNLISNTYNDTQSDESVKNDRNTECRILREKLLQILPNEESLTNYLIYMFYEDKKGASKSTMWMLIGKQIFENLKSKVDTIQFPVKDEDGDIIFLYEKYKIKDIIIKKDEEVLDKIKNI